MTRWPLGFHVARTSNARSEGGTPSSRGIPPAPDGNAGATAQNRGRLEGVSPSLRSTGRNGAKGAASSSNAGPKDKLSHTP